MAKPIISLELSDDENSVFIYSGNEPDGTRQLEACLGRQREDFEFQTLEWVKALMTDVLR